MEVTLQLRCVLVYQFTASFSLPALHYICFSYNDMFFRTSGLHFFTSTLRMEITLQLRIVLACPCEVFLWRQHLHYLFSRCSYIFYDVTVRLYFGTLELWMKVTLQLRFVCIRHCHIFFVTSQLHYLFVRCSYDFQWR